MDSADGLIAENRRIRRAMRDVVALSILPAVWSGLSREGIAQSLADALLSALSLDLIYIRLREESGDAPFECLRTKRANEGSDEQIKALLASRLKESAAGQPFTINLPGTTGELQVATARFGVSDNSGVLVAGSRRADFPSEQDRLLLSVGANQTGIVLRQREAEETQRRTAQHRNVRWAVTHALNEATSVQGMATAVLRAVCEGLGWDVGAFWRVDEHGETLVCDATWHSPDKPLHEFIAATSERKLKPGQGLPGRVWANRKSEWIPDVTDNASFVRKEPAREGGLRGAFACPIAFGERCLGVIEFFTKSMKPPDPDLLETMDTVAGHIGQCIQRQRTTEELRQREADLADFFESASVGLHWVGPDGTILRANRSELQLLGYTRDEYVGRSISDFHVDEDVICDILGKLKAGEKLAEYPARLRCKDGSIKDVLIDSSVLWKEGQFIHTRCFTRDVTDRKRAEDALSDARSQLHAALEAGAISTWIWDIPNNRLSAGPHLARLFNVSPADAEVGLLDKYVDAIHPDDLQSVMDALTRSVETGELYEADYRIVQPDGSVKWVAARGRVEHDRAGQAARMPGVIVDITERKELEADLKVRVEQLAEANRRKQELLASLQESEEKLRLLADTIPQLAWMARPDGWTYWYNRRWYEYTGTTPETVEGWDWQVVHDKEALPGVVAKWKECIATGEPFEMVFPLKGADGVFRPFLTRVNPLRDEHGRILHWFGTNTDISEIKKMEDALRDADRRKDEFLATLAHELRNPLAPIRNSLQILKMSRVDGATAQQAKEMMERQLQSLTRLVDDLLDVARVMRGKIELRKERVELATIVARAVETAQSLIESQGQELQLSLPPESLLVHADPVRLTQVIANLLTNSAKYSNANGHIWLSAERVGEDVVLHVRDDGIGIAPELLPHIFDVFVQANHAFAKSQGGLGIGLTLVKNLTELHGGSVSANSRGLGQGAEFSVRLPLLADLPARLDGAPAPMEEEQSSGHKLLVVDDNRDAALSLAMLLRLKGHDVRVAHDGPSALAMAASFQPSLVFLDIGMPDMDGYEVAQRMRQLPGPNDFVLAALTGWGQEDDRRRTLAAGFDHHLVKPPEHDVLENLLARLK